MKKTITITKYYCDVCNNECQKEDMFIEVATSNIEFISGRLMYAGRSDSIVCKVCQHKYLTKYLNSFGPNTNLPESNRYTNYYIEYWCEGRGCYVRYNACEPNNGKFYTLEACKETLSGLKLKKPRILKEDIKYSYIHEI